MKKLLESGKRTKVKMEEEIKDLDDSIIFQHMKSIKKENGSNIEKLITQQENNKEKFKEEATEMQKSWDSLRRKIKKQERIMNQSKEKL